MADVEAARRQPSTFELLAQLAEVLAQHVPGGIPVGVKRDVDGRTFHAELDMDSAQFLRLEADIDLVRAIGLARRRCQDGGELGDHGFWPAIPGERGLALRAPTRTRPVRRRQP